jgi:nitrogen regulatory protein PII-like uncharacterized protein
MKALKDIIREARLKQGIVLREVASATEINDLKDEKLANEILKVAEQKIEYSKKGK